MSVLAASLGFPPRHRSAGSVIVLVLVTVLLAAFMLTKFVARAGTELLADAKASERTRLRREAYSALEVTLAVLADVRANSPALAGPSTDWEHPLAYAGYVPADGVTAEVGFENESARISLPRANAATLEQLFMSLDVDRALAERASDALLGWMHRDYVAPTLAADPGDYERAVPPHHAAGRPLRSFSELAAVAVVREVLFDDTGRPNERFKRFTAAVSRFAFDQVKPDAGNVGADAPLMRVTVTVRDGGNYYRLAAVVAAPGKMSAPARAPLPTGRMISADDKAAVVLKKLDYPFEVMEVAEDMELPDPSRSHD